MKDILRKSITGHVLIRDIDSGTVLVDKFNAINYENFSIALAQTLGNRPDSWIQNMAFGNGAATVSGTGQVTYLQPNVVGTSAKLYNETYFKCVNDLSPLNPDPSNNYIKVFMINYMEKILSYKPKIQAFSGHQEFFEERRASVS